MLKKYVLDLYHIMSQELKEVQEALTYEEKLVKILDRVKQGVKIQGYTFV